MRKGEPTTGSIIRGAWVPAAGAASAVALPRLMPMGLYLDARARRWCSLGLALLGSLAIAGYILAVNAMLLAGVAIRGQAQALGALERDQTRLREQFIQLQSPAWLEQQSRREGMVRADGIRYLLTDSALTLRQ